MAADLYVLSTTELMDASSVAITGSTTASGMPVSNLNTPFHFEKWRTNNLTSHYVEIDLGAAKSVYYVWLGYTNFRPGTTQWRIRAATSQANLTAAPDYDSTAVDVDQFAGYDATNYATDWPYGAHAFLYVGSGSWTELANKRWWRLDFTDAAHPDGYFEAGRLIIGGASWKPAIGPAYGSQIPAERPTKDWARSRSGALFPSFSQAPTVMEFDFKELTFAEASALRQIGRLRGSHKEVLSMWLGELGNAEQTMVHGYISGMEAMKATYSTVYSAQVEIESAA